ncbi:MAG: hypothetical protein ACRD0P_23380 [Stackebrandtia sp.]
MSEMTGIPEVEKTLPKPLPVWVEIGPMLAASVTTATDRPLWLRRAGLRVTAEPVPGVLVRWVRGSGGGWLGLCDVVMTSHDCQLRVEVRQLVPTKHIKPR